MKLKLQSLFVFTAVVAVWLALLLQAPFLYLLIAPAPICIVAALWDTHPPFYVRAIFGGMVALAVQMLSCAALVGINMLKGSPEGTPAQYVSSAASVLLLCTGWSTWTCLLCGAVYTVWSVVRFLSTPYFEE